MGEVGIAVVAKILWHSEKHMIYYKLKHSYTGTGKKSAETLLPRYIFSEISGSGSWQCIKCSGSSSILVPTYENSYRTFQIVFFHKVPYRL